jgi:hypothetical protein
MIKERFPLAASDMNPIVQRAVKCFLCPFFPPVRLPGKNAIPRCPMMHIAHADSSLFALFPYLPYTKAIPSLYQLLLIAE